MYRISYLCIQFKMFESNCFTKIGSKRGRVLHRAIGYNYFPTHQIVAVLRR